MKKVLLLNAGTSLGGIEKLEFEYVKHINDNSIETNMLVLDKNSLKNCPEAVENSHVYDLGITKLTRKTEWIFNYRLFKLLKKHKYDIVHINSCVFFFSLRTAITAKLAGVKKIIIHSHGNIHVNPIKRILITIFNPFYRSFFNKYLACSKDALLPLFTQNFINKGKAIILKNGIKIEDFKYNEQIRNQYRNELKLDGNIVYGHIGRFETVKNHEYLIDLFYKIQERQSNSVLLLVGNGSLEDTIKENVKHLGIENKVLFLGFREDVSNIINAMDVFIFPSVSEGLGIAAIEAQTNGIPTFASTGIPNEANISSFFHHFDLNCDKNDLVNRILDEKIDTSNRYTAYKYTIQKGYDIDSVCNELKKIYMDL